MRFKLGCVKFCRQVSSDQLYFSVGLMSHINDKRIAVAKEKSVLGFNCCCEKVSGEAIDAVVVVPVSMSVSV